MNSLAFLHNILTDATSLLNFVVSVELAIACGVAVISGWLTDKANVGKIVVLSAITAMLFRVWQY
jgi:hypothetical protein